MLMILGVWQPWFTYVSHTNDVTGAPFCLKSPTIRLFVHSCLRLSTEHKLWNTVRWEGGPLMPGRISWEMASNDVKIIHVMAPAYQEAGIHFTLRCCYYRNVTQVLMTFWSIVTDEIHRFCCRKMWPMCYEKTCLLARKWYLNVNTNPNNSIDGHDPASYPRNRLMQKQT